MNKSVFAILVLLCSFQTLTSQKNFSGSIKYKGDFKINNPGISEQALKDYFGSGSTFYFDSGQYYQVYDGGMMEFDYLNPKTSLYYTKEVGNDTIFVYDATKVEDQKILESSHQEVIEEVLDFECKQFNLKVKIESADAEYFMKFFYTDEIKIDGSQFKNVKKSFANIVYGNLNSIPLKFEIGDQNFTTISVATEINYSDDLNLENELEKRLNSHPVKMMK